MIFKKNKIITNLVIFTLIIFFLANSKIIISSVSNSTNIFLQNILPSLFIYLFITEVLINSNKADELSIGISRAISKIFKIPQNTTSTVIIGFLLGYPNSAKYILKLYNDGKITNSTATKLVSFTSNANMAYIIGTIGVTMLNNISYGIVLAISHFLASIILGIVIKTPKFTCIIQQTKIKENSFKKIYSYFDILYMSIIGSLKTLGMIFCYTVIFSLIPVIFLNYLKLPDFINGIIIGIFELSNGIKSISFANIPIQNKLVVISFILSFSSIMVIMQIYSFVHVAKVKFKDLLKYKLIQGLFSCIITYIITLFMNFASIEVYSSSYELTKKALIIPSIIYSLLILFTIIIFSFLYRKKRQ